MNYEQIVGQIVQASRDFRLHDKRRVECALSAGRNLLLAKKAVNHGDFLALLKRAELNARAAQRWMALSSAAWTVSEIQEVGGINAAAALSSERIREKELEVQLAHCQDKLNACKEHEDRLERKQAKLLAILIERDGEAVVMENLQRFRDGQAEIRRLAAEHDRIAGLHSEELAQRKRFEKWAKSHGWKVEDLQNA